MRRTPADREAEAVRLGRVRRALVAPGNLRDEIGFQNDINLLLSQLEEREPPWRPAAALFRPTGTDFVDDETAPRPLPRAA